MNNTSLYKIRSPEPFNPEHLPPGLKSKKNKYDGKVDYWLGQARQAYEHEGLSLQAELEKWQDQNYAHSPEDVIGHPEWENYYAALISVDGPDELIEATEPDKRYSTTQLLKGLLTKKDSARLLQRAQDLVCSLDPRDKDFFTEETLSECLSIEGLDTDAKINSELGRKIYANVTKSNRREALALLWERRTAISLIEPRLNSEQWEGWEYQYEACRDFAFIALNELFGTLHIRGKDDLELSAWSAIRGGEERDRCYFLVSLNPTMEYIWHGLSNFVKEVRSAGYNCDSPLQWMKDVGLEKLFRLREDWWDELPDQIDDNERMKVREFNLDVMDEVRNSPVRQLIVKKYSQKIRAVLGNA